MDVKSGANDRHSKNVTIVASGIICDGGQFKTDRSFWDYSLSNYRSAENPGWIYNDNALFVTADQIWVHVFNEITSAQNVYARACTLPLYTLAEFKGPVFCIISAMWNSATITKKNHIRKSMMFYDAVELLGLQDSAVSFVYILTNFLESYRNYLLPCLNVWYL